MAAAVAAPAVAAAAAAAGAEGFNMEILEKRAPMSSTHHQLHHHSAQYQNVINAIQYLTINRLISQSMMIEPK